MKHTYKTREHNKATSNKATKQKPITSASDTRRDIEGTGTVVQKGSGGRRKKRDISERIPRALVFNGTQLKDNVTHQLDPLIPPLTADGSHGTNSRNTTHTCTKPSGNEQMSNESNMYYVIC